MVDGGFNPFSDLARTQVRPRTRPRRRYSSFVFEDEDEDDDEYDLSKTEKRATRNIADSALNNFEN